MSTHVRPGHLLVLLLSVLFSLQAVAQSSESTPNGTRWEYGVKAAIGYFNFRDSLFVNVGPDPPGNLSDDWTEFFIKPWVSFERETNIGTWFGSASFIYAKTGDDASEVSGGGAGSADFDDLYIGWRYGAKESGQFELSGGRLPYQVAHGFLISDGYADGGSRGALWNNPRVAWAPGARARYLYGGHTVEVFYLERDDRPEFDADVRFSGINYEWLSSDSAWNIGGSYMAFKANELGPDLDGADVWNLRLYFQPFSAPLTIEAEWAYEDNGPLLDATAWYIQPFWTWEEIKWQPTIYYRYAFFEGDNPNTVADEDFDPLFPAFYDWGSWWQGEIAGEYFLANSNLKTHMLRLHTKPTNNIGTGLIYFDYSLDQPGSYQDGVTSSDLAREINWYMDWSVNKMFTLSFVLARNNPGAAVKEAFNRSKSFKYGMIQLNFAY
jgi:hypothetical protein